VRDLAAQADAVVFGGAEPTDRQTREFWAQVDVALARMRATMTRRQRWKGRVTTRSLRGRARTRRSTGTTSSTGSTARGPRLPRRRRTKGQDR
jgi:hypothetical protein